MRYFTDIDSYATPEITITECSVERGFEASGDEYGEAGEAGDGYEDIFNGSF
ncbi:MAG: hypothetical protein IKJ38_01430 [Alistipes sp.]|nr:hypothetical protein [Alistipes sp.]